MFHCDFSKPNILTPESSPSPFKSQEGSKTFPSNTQLPILNQFKLQQKMKSLAFSQQNFRYQQQKLSKVVVINDLDLQLSFIHELELHEVTMADLFKEINKRYPQYRLKFSDNYGFPISINDKSFLEKYQAMFPLHITSMQRKSIKFEISFGEKQDTLFINDIKGEKFSCAAYFLKLKYGVKQENITFELVINNDTTLKWVSWCDAIENCNLTSNTIQIMVQEKNENPSNCNGIESFSYEKHTLFVKTPINQIIRIYPKGDSFKIADIKAIIKDKEGVPVENQQLSYENLSFEDDNRTLADYQISPYQTISLELKPSTSPQSPKLPQSESCLSKSAINSIDFEKNGPFWRSVSKNGLYLDGICTNEYCQAYQKNVIIPKGMGTYNTQYDETQNECPSCGDHVRVTKCAFTGCSYSYCGLRLGSTKEQIYEKVNAQEFSIVAKGSFKFFDLQEAWGSGLIHLVIIVKPIEQILSGMGIKCGACNKVIQENDSNVKSEECGHLYHKECTPYMNRLDVNCVLCCL